VYGSPWCISGIFDRIWGFVSEASLASSAAPLTAHHPDSIFSDRIGVCGVSTAPLSFGSVSLATVSFAASCFKQVGFRCVCALIQSVLQFRRIYVAMDFFRRMTFGVCHRFESILTGQHHHSHLGFSFLDFLVT